MAARIVLNGTPVAPDAPAHTVAALLAARSIDPAHVVVEINREIIDRDRFGTFVLRDGDVVEILRFVGGG